MTGLTKYLTTLILSIVATIAWGQNNDMLKQFLTVENGLSHNEVTAIVQDNDGFIWIGTRGGLNRYDGYEFKIFNQDPENENSLVNPSVETLFVDSKGNIWIGTKSGGVSKYNPHSGRFTNFKHNYKKRSDVLPIHRALSFYEDKEGKIWIGTWAKGVLVFDEKNNSFKQYLNGFRVSSITSTEDNRIFIGTNHGPVNIEGALFEYDPLADTLFQLAEVKCRQIVYDEPRNVLWIVSGDNIGTGSEKEALTKFDLRNNKTVKYGIDDSKASSEKLPHASYSLLLNKDGHIWVGNWGTGMYVFNPQEQSFKRRFIYPEGMAHRNKDYDAVLEMFQDRDNNIWVGTNGGGVCILSENMGFKSVGYNAKTNQGLHNSRVMSVLEDKQKNLWIGTIGNGLFWTPNRQEYYQVKTPELRNTDRFFVVKYIFEDKQGIIWVGTNIGVFRIHFEQGNPVLKKAIDEFGKQVANQTVVSFLDYDGMLWLGTLSRGLYCVDNKTYELKKYQRSGMTYPEGMRSNRISYLFKDSRDRVWLGTYNGLHVLNKADTTIHLAERHYEIKGTFTGNIITCIGEDQKGNIWVGTPNGLNRLAQTGKEAFELNYFTEKHGLASNFIKGIACDFKGNVWFSSNTGISKYVANENRFINFNETDGVRGSNFTEASVCRGHSGEIFFGGTQGVTYFDPEQIVEHQLALKPIFTELKVLNQSIEIGEKYNSKVILEASFSETKELKLAYNQNKLEIGFSALDFVSLGTNNYEFKLEDSDTEWNKIGDRRFIIFTDLDPGEYLLKVRSSNRHNLWSEEIAELKIEIEPPFWRTWYALVLYIFIALSIITIIRWNAVKQVRLANSLEMERLQHEQDRKLSEMKMRFFTNISHEFRTPLTLILAPLKEILNRKEEFRLNEEFSNKLNVIQNNSLRLMGMVNQLLDFRKVESGNMKLYACKTNLDDFVAEVCYPFYELARINNIEFSQSTYLKTSEIWFDRDKLEIVLNNLISNAFKYVKDNGKIEVSVYEEEDEVLIAVADNGPGIPSTELNHIFERFYQLEKKAGNGGAGIGLALSKRFVEMHHGSISVSSEPNVNTEFIVALPKGKLHLKPEEIVEPGGGESGLIKKEIVFNTAFTSKAKIKKTNDIRILVVDDTEEVRNYLVQLLETRYDVDDARDGVEGIAKVKNNKYDLVISDVMMPKMDGFEFCKKLRSKESTSTLPFILLTAKNSEQFRLMGEQAGANDYISKPFDPALLLEKVKNILERQKLYQKQFSKSVRLEPSDIEITASEETFIRSVIDTIEKNLHNSQFSSEVLAAEMNRSYSSLYRKLKKLTGLSAAEFIRSIRIKRAGQLLADREKNISEVAYEVGFNDVKHFRTVFQKHFGCSPSKYREKF